MPQHHLPRKRFFLSICTAMFGGGVFASPIDAPAGHAPAFSWNAKGTQIYECTFDAKAGFAWTFRAPEADLFEADGKTVARHYAGPIWESTSDGSKIQGARVASEPSANPGAIAQLLLSATVLQMGPTFGRVSYIQRLNTTGGSAPASGCEAGTLGAELKVPYSATYRFFLAR